MQSNPTTRKSRSTPGLDARKIRRERIERRLKICWVLWWALFPLFAHAVLPETLWNDLVELVTAFRPTPSTNDSGSGSQNELVGFLLVAGSIALISVPFAWKTREHVAAFLFERCFDAFDDGLFDPIEQHPPTFILQRSGHGPHGSRALPWMEPVDGVSKPARVTQWHMMQAWVLEGVEVRDGSGKKFTWALITGRAGGGKSRTAYELGLWLRQGQPQHSQETVSPSQSADDEAGPSRLMVAWRRARRTPIAPDPWDVGYLAHQRIGESPATLVHKDPTYRAALKEWRPRAPTLILCEDPRMDEAEAVLDLLMEQSLQYVFPVRLLLINQSIPSGLDLRSAGPDGAVHSTRGHFGGHWIVDEHSYFSAQEIHRLISRCFNPTDRRGWINKPELIQAIETITQDYSPLLVELLLRWVENQAPGKTPALSDLTASVLLNDRAQRVLASMRTAGLTEHHHRCLVATATIVGGATRAQLSTAADRADMEQPAGSTSAPLPSIEVMEQVFPHENIEERIPAIRPELVGWAFVDAVIETPPHSVLQGESTPEQQEATARLIAKMAWAIDSYGALRAMDRLQALGGAVGDQARGARAMLLASLKEAGKTSDTDPQILADAYARYHMTHGQSLSDVRSSIEQLEPAQARALAFKIVDTYLVNPAVARRDALAVFSVALGKAFDGSDVTLSDTELDDLCHAVERLCGWIGPPPNVKDVWEDIPTNGFQALGHRLGRRAVECASAQRDTAPLEQKITQLLDRMTDRQRIKETVRSSWAEALYAEVKDVEQLEAVALRCRAASFEQDSSIEEIQNFTTLLQTTAQRWTSLAQIELLGFAWIQVTRIHALANRWSLIDACISEFERLIAPYRSLPFNEQVRLATYQARAWCWAAWGYSQIENPAEAERCANQIDQILVPFAALSLHDQRALVEEQAVAWSSAAWGYGQIKNPAEAERCAKQIDHILLPFTTLALHDRRVLVERQAQAWSSAAWGYGQIKNPAEAERCAKQIDHILLPFTTLALHDRRVLVEHQARAWSSAAWGYGQINNPAEAERCAKQIDHILLPFTTLALHDRRVLVEHQARAWSSAAWGYGQINNPAEAERCAKQIDHILLPFTTLSLHDQQVLLTPQVEAWVFAAYGYSRINNPAEAERCAKQIDHILLPFTTLALHDRRVLVQRQAQAWSSAAWGYAKAKRYSEAHACAQHIDAVVAPFAVLTLKERQSIETEQMEAWGWVAWAYGNREEPERAKEYAEKLDAIAASYSTLPLMERIIIVSCQSCAWAGVACGYKYHRQATAAEACARRIDEMVTPFLQLPLPDRLSLAERQAEAWTHVAETYDQLNELPEVERCKSHLEAIVRPFDELPESERQVLEKWRQAAARLPQSAQTLSS